MFEPPHVGSYGVWLVLVLVLVLGFAWVFEDEDEKEDEDDWEFGSYRPAAAEPVRT